MAWRRFSWLYHAALYSLALNFYCTFDGYKGKEILNVHHFGFDVNLYVCDGAANVTLTQLYVVYRKWGEIDPIFIICFVLIFAIPIHKRIH